nr:MAG: hypothetical protein [Sanya fiers-like virus 18]
MASPQLTTTMKKSSRQRLSFTSSWKTRICASLRKWESRIPWLSPGNSSPSASFWTGFFLSAATSQTLTRRLAYNSQKEELLFVRIVRKSQRSSTPLTAVPTATSRTNQFRASAKRIEINRKALATPPSQNVPHLKNPTFNATPSQRDCALLRQQRR